MISQSNARRALRSFFHMQADAMDDSLNPGMPAFPACPMRGNARDLEYLTDYCRDFIEWPEEAGIDPGELALAMIAEAQRDKRAIG